MTVGSLFSGIGGFDLGLRNAGFDISWQVEKDSFCKSVLEKRFPEATRYGDIRSVGKHNLSTVDVVCGGFPCQPFSSAGKRGGSEDDRFLWPEMLRVISELKPSWVIAENVYGLAVGKMEPIFEQVLSDLETEGYDVQAFVIPACGVDARHIRRRVWIVAYAEGKRFSEAWTGGAGPQKWSCRAGKESPNVAYRTGQGLEKREGICTNTSEGKKAFKRDCIAIPHTKGHGRNHWDDCQDIGASNREKYPPKNYCWNRGRLETRRWPIEPEVDRVAYGLSHWMVEDEIRGLGNAIVPRHAELFGLLIHEIEYIKSHDHHPLP